MILKNIETKQDFEIYKSRVENFLAVSNIKPGCFSPHREGENDSEPFFSWSNCECCNRPLGGTREKYSFATNNGKIFDADICQDCIYFLTYGELDDLTMMNLK